MNYKYFSLDEFECKCGCKTNNIDPDFVKLLDIARAHAGHPFLVTSGVRCAEHNKAVGGSPTSSHMDGLAVDIFCKNSSARYKILTSLLKVGFTRIGIYKNFVHVDIDGKKPQNVMWYL